MRKKKNRYRADKTIRRKVLKSWAKATGGFILAVFSVLLLSAALAHSYYALLEAPWLRVEEIQVSGLKHVERKEILNVLGIARNTNVLTLRMSELAARLEALPWLKSVVVRLDPPGRIVVEVAEREALAVIRGEDFFLLDKEGKLFARTTPESNPDLLVLSGFSGMGLEEGYTLHSEPLEALREFLSALDKCGNWLPVQLVSECTWNAQTGFMIRIAQKEFPVQLGTENLDQKFNRLRSVFGMLTERQWMDLVIRIDLDYFDRAYIEGHFPISKGI